MLKLFTEDRVQSEDVKAAELASSSESHLSALCGPSEVTARVERLLCDVIDKVEAALKQLPQHGVEVMAKMHDSNSSRQPDITDAEVQRRPAIGNSDVSSPIVLNERPGVRYLCCDRFFKCDGRNLIAREIWPSDGGFIELNRKELKRFIINNKARRLSEPKIRRHVAGRSSLEYSTDSSKQRIVRDNNAPVTESIIQSCRSDLCEVHEHKAARNLSQFNSRDEDVQTQQQLHMEENFADTLSQTSLTSITESTETLISSETIDFKSSTADESLSNKHEPLIGAYNFMRHEGHRLAPTMKSDGSVVIPGVVHVNNFDNLNGVILELKVLIKSPNESKRIDVKIDCPEFKPKSVIVNGIETHRLIDYQCKTL